MNLFLLALGRLSFLVLLEEVLAEIHDRQTGGSAFGETSTRSSETPLASSMASLQRHYARLLTLCVNNPDFLGIYFFITPYALCGCDPKILQYKNRSRHAWTPISAAASAGKRFYIAA